VPTFVAPPDDGVALVATLRSELAESRGAEQAARRLASIVESSVDAMSGANLDGVITDWNPAAQRLFGYTSAEALGRPSSMLSPTTQEAEVGNLLRRVSQGEFIENVEVALQRKDGTPIEVMLSISPIRDAVGDIVGMASISRDVTERRHDERTIAALHAIAYSAGHIMDAARLVTLTTAQVRDAFRVDALFIDWWDEASQTLRPIGNPGEIAAIPLAGSELRPGEGLAGVVFQARSPLIVEDYASWPQAQLQFKGGVGSAMGVPMYVGEQVVGVLTAVAIARRSFTEHDLQLLTRFAAEVAPAIAVGQLLADAQARREEAEALAARVSVYFRANPVPGLIARRVDNTFVDVNDAFVELLGHRRGELVGKTLSETAVFAEPEELSTLLATLDQIGQSRAEVTLCTGSGERRSVLAFFELTEIAGEACLIVGCVDLTEQKRAAAMDQRQQVVEEANRAKSEFLANMSHELRTPLNAVLGFSDLLLEQLKLENPELRYLRNIRQAGSHLLDLINDVLDISKVEAGKMELRPEVVSLAALLAPVIASASSSAGAKTVAFALDTVEAPVLFLDTTRVRQILYNLLSNAVKFTAAGGSVHLRISLEGADLAIDVADTGIGIPVELQGRVFGMFERLHEGQSSAPGTGLGLALTKRLVELHGGSITFESAVKKGTTFHVILPGVRSEVIHGERILIVEDHPHDADLVVALAGKAGLRTEVVRSLAQAREALARNLPLGVVVDLHLPDGRGEELVLEIRNLAREPAVPVILMTVDAEPSGLLPLGAVDDHLTKPIDRPRMERWLEVVARAARGTPGEMGELLAHPAD
jgi:PAS domain S-box-containing protein